MEVDSVGVTDSFPRYGRAWMAGEVAGENTSRVLTIIAVAERSPRSKGVVVVWVKETSRPPEGLYRRENPALAYLLTVSPAHTFPIFLPDRGR